MAETDCDIVFAMTGDLHRNARALRQLGALSAAGRSVTVLSLAPGKLHTSLPAGIAQQVVAVPGGSGPLFFRAVHRRYREEASRLRAGVYHASDLYVLRAMRGAAGRNGAPFTYDARELYAHVASTQRRPWVSRFWSTFEAGPIRQAAAVWTVSDSIADHLAGRYGIARPFVQHNAPKAGPAAPDAFLREITGLPDSMTLFVHLGQMRAGRGGSTLIKALADAPGAALAFLGYGPELEPLRSAAMDSGVQDRVHFVAPVPPDRIRSALSGADVGITLLEDTCLNHRFALPNKLFDYFAAGLPVLSSRLPEIERIVSTHEAGVTVDASKVEEVSAAMRRMVGSPAERNRWGSNALSASEAFDWSLYSMTFGEVFEGLLTDAPHSAP